MNPQKIFWAQNLKVLRNKKKLSQESLAEQLSMSRSKYNAHENGQTTNPPVDDLLRISDYFKLSIDTLLRIDLSKLSISKLKELEAGNDAYQAGTQLRVLAISVDKDNKENMEYVPVKAKAGYRAGYNDPEFIATLPKFSLPNLPDNGSYRMFPTTGDSMLPIPEDSDVIARFVQNWQQLKPRSLCIVILKGEQDFVFKQATLEADGMLLLESLNRTYQPYHVAVADVLEIWQYHSFQTKAIPEPETDMQVMAKAIKEMQQAIQGLKKK
jgi:transcriptional regulator with XRE-family HTH domain